MPSGPNRAANKNMNRIKVKISYGPESYERCYPQNSTFQAILDDVNLKAVAGWGDRLRMMVSGVEMPASTTLSDGMSIVVETACNEKA